MAEKIEMRAARSRENTGIFAFEKRKKIMPTTWAWRCIKAEIKKYQKRFFAMVPAGEMSVTREVLWLKIEYGLTLLLRLRKEIERHPENILIETEHGIDFSPVFAERLLPHLNSLRQDLVLWGLNPKQVKAMDLDAYIREKYASRSCAAPSRGQQAGQETKTQGRGISESSPAQTTGSDKGERQ